MRDTDDRTCITRRFDNDIDLALAKVALEARKKADLAQQLLPRIERDERHQQVDIPASLSVAHARSEQPHTHVVAKYLGISLPDGGHLRGSQPHKVQQYLKTLQLLEANPYHPSLRLHALHGNLAGLHSVSINLSYRITLEFLIGDQEIIPVDVGNHDAVY